MLVSNIVRILFCFLSLIAFNPLLAQEKKIDLSQIHTYLFEYYEFEKPHQAIKDSAQILGETFIVDYQKDYNALIEYSDLCFPNSKKLDSLNQMLQYQQQLLLGLSNYQQDFLLLKKRRKERAVSYLIDEIIITKIASNPTLNTQQLLPILTKNEIIEKAFEDWSQYCQNDWQSVKSKFFKNQTLSPAIEQDVLKFINFKNY